MRKDQLCLKVKAHTYQSFATNSWLRTLICMAQDTAKRVRWSGAGSIQADNPALLPPAPLNLPEQGIHHNGMFKQGSWNQGVRTGSYLCEGLIALPHDTCLTTKDGPDLGDVHHCLVPTHICKAALVEVPTATRTQALWQLPWHPVLRYLQHWVASSLPLRQQPWKYRLG